MTVTRTATHGPVDVVTVSAGEDGVRFEFTAVENTEAGTPLVIAVPAAGVLLTGDLASADAHPFLAGRSLGPWTQALPTLRAGAPDVVLPGRGIPIGPAALERTLGDLCRARTDLAEAVDAADLDARLDTAFPGFGGRRMQALPDRFLFS